MTSKTLVHTLTRPLISIPFLMAAMTVQAAPSDAGVLEMVDIMAHPHHYDHQDVVVMGTVTNVQPVTDRDGQPAYKFFLQDAAGMLKVISRTPVEEGDQVVVEGVFTRRRQGGRIPVYNEVNAASVRPVNRFHPDLVG